MKCKKIHSKLIFFLEGSLPVEEKEQINLHLNSCLTCAAFVKEMEKTLEIIAQEKSPEVNPFFYTRVKAKLENEAAPEKITILRPVLNRVLQPVFFSILLLIGIYGGYKIGQPSENFSEVAVNQEIIPYLNEMDAEPIENFLID